MDGRNRTVIINTNVPLTHGLTLDYKAQVLYWVDNDYRNLESSNVDGTNRKILIDELSGNIGLSLFRDTLFLSQSSNRINNVSTTGQNFTSVISYSTLLCYQHFRQLKIFSETRQPQICKIKYEL